MKKWIHIICGVLISCTIHSMDIPRIINYQGFLRDSEEKPIEDAYVDIHFRIYNESDNLVWEEEHTNVHVHNGLFNVLLGSHNPMNVVFNELHSLRIQFNTEPEMEQEMTIGFTPYSFRSMNSFTVKNYEVDDIPAPNKLLPLDKDGKFSADVIPDDITQDEYIKKNTPDTTFTSTSSEVLRLKNTGSGPALEVLSNNGKAVHAKTAASDQAAIQGEHSAEGAGIRGVSDAQHGVIGFSEAKGKAGVYGNNTKGIGVWGNSQKGTGVHGQSLEGYGIYGTSAGLEKSGIYAESTKGPAIKGRSQGDDGMVGLTNDNAHSGVYGHSTVGIGVTGRSENHVGIVGVSQSNDPFNAGVRGRSQGMAMAVNSEGDLHVTGAIYGNRGPNQGASIPNPAYDSDWQLFPDSAISLSLTHNLGGNVDNYFVYLQYEHGGKQNHYGYGLEMSKYVDGIAYYGTTFYGAFWQNLTNHSIMISRSFWTQPKIFSIPDEIITMYDHPSLPGHFRVLIWVYD